MINSLRLCLVALMAVGIYGQSIPQPGSCGVFKTKASGTSRIVNGETAVPNSRPYQLLLIGYSPDSTAKHYCGASLVTSTHALTAAHCVAGDKPENVYIHTGIHEFTADLLTKAQGIPAKQIFMHESYNANSLLNDVAIIRLSQPVEVDNDKVGLICLPDKNSKICANGDPVVASGWGSTTGNPNRTSASRPVELQQVALKCIPNNQEDCKKLTHILSIFDQKQKMCAYGEYKSVCFGDSGGPLVREMQTKDGLVYTEQVGIMSGTIDCSFTKPHPDLYANVRELSDWIFGKIKASP